MAPKQKGENTKKAAGNAKKAENAAKKAAEADAKAEASEQSKWKQGSKDSSKKEAAAEKAAEAARKKEEKARLLAEEEAGQPSKPKSAGAKKAEKKNAAPSKGTLDISQLDLEPTAKKTALNASGIDDAIDALSIANSKGGSEKIDRHPERRFKAAYNAFEERKLEEMKDDKSLRRQQKIEMIRKEFEKSSENPFNQAMAGRFDMSKEEMSQLREDEREKIESRLGSP